MGTQIAEWQRDAEEPIDFTLADFRGAPHRPEFDTPELHETEQALCCQMQRFGLSEEQQHDLFDTVWDIADIVLEQQQASKQ
jgi:hypothetical protein